MSQSPQYTFEIITDAFSNLPGNILSALGIHVLPCTYFVEEAPVSYDGDIDRFDAHTYYELMRQGKRITTSLVNVQTFLDCFRPLVEQGKDLLYVGLSSGVSGTFQSAKHAAAELMEQFPDRVIRVVDSLGASLGTGLLACRAADNRSRGDSVREAADELETAKGKLCQFFTVESLEYLRRSGRVSAATAAIGSVLNIKPLLYGDPTGHIVSCAKHRGRKRVVAAMAEKYRALAARAADSRVAISHGDCPEEAEQLARCLCEIAKPKELIICPHEPFTGAHVGPGMLGLFFFGTAKNTQLPHPL